MKIKDFIIIFVVAWIICFVYFSQYGALKHRIGRIEDMKLEALKSDQKKLEKNFYEILEKQIPEHKKYKKFKR